MALVTGKGSSEQGRPQRPRAQISNLAAETVEAAARALITFDSTVAAQILGICKETLRDLIREKRLAAYYQGHTLRVPAWSIQEYQEAQAAKFSEARAAMVGRSMTPTRRKAFNEMRQKLNDERRRMKAQLNAARAPGQSDINAAA